MMRIVVETGEETPSIIRFLDVVQILETWRDLVEELGTILAENLHGFAKLSAEDDQIVRRAGEDLDTPISRVMKSIANLIAALDKVNVPKEENDGLKDALAPEMTVPEKTHRLLTNIWQSLNLLTRRMKTANEKAMKETSMEQLAVLNSLKFFFMMSGIPSILSQITLNECKDNDGKSKFISFLIRKYDEMILTQIFAKLVKYRPKEFLPHIDDLYHITVGEKADHSRFIMICESSHPFIRSMIDLLPTLQEHCDDNQKSQVYRMFSYIIDFFDAFISVAIRVHHLEEPQFEHKIDEFYTNLLHAIGIYCRPLETNSQKKNIDATLNDSDGKIRQTGNGERLFNAFKRAYRSVGLNYEVRTWIAIDLCINALGATGVNEKDFLIIGALDCIFESDDRCLEAHMEKIKQKLATYLRKMCSANFSVSSAQGLSDATKNGKFLRLLVNTAITMLHGPKEPKLCSSLYKLIVALCQKLEIDSDVFVDRIIRQTMASTHSSENDQNAIDEKSQAIQLMKLLASRAVNVVSRHLQMCYDSVHNYLCSPEVILRKLSVEAIGQFIVSFVKLAKIERATQNAEKVLPHFAKMLKTDKMIVAVAVFDVYILLLTNATHIFNDQPNWIDEIVKSIADVLRGDVACQREMEQSNDTKLMQKALELFPKLGMVAQPIALAAYFENVLPILCEILRCGHSGPLRSIVYRVVGECIAVLKDCASNSFDTLLSMLLAAMEAEDPLERRNSILAIGELLTHNKPNADENAEPISQAFTNTLANEQCASVVDDACGIVAKLCAKKFAAFPVDRFLPQIIGKLNQNEIHDQSETVFDSFNNLISSNAETFRDPLRAILSAVVRIWSADEKKSTSTCKSIKTFLIAAHHHFRDFFQQMEHGTDMDCIQTILSSKFD